MLVNNAGIMAVPFAHTTDGYESQWGTNVVGHFALIKGLLPTLEHTASHTPSGMLLLLSSPLLSSVPFEMSARVSGAQTSWVLIKGLLPTLEHTASHTPSGMFLPLSSPLLSSVLLEMSARVSGGRTSWATSPSSRASFLR